MRLLRSPTNIFGALSIVVVMLNASFAAPGGAEPGPEGHWEQLAEDGVIWVPAQPPKVTYLPPGDLGDYHNHTEAAALLHSLATGRPDVFTQIQVGTSVDGRAIWMLRATGPGDDSARARVLLDAAHHGNEVIASETLVRFLREIDETYDSDPTVRAVLNATVVDVVPMVNVDSNLRIPQCSHYAMCRKNSNGVDLNRNYADHWGGPGSSGDPRSATYRGPAPLSEPETQAIATLLDENDYALHASLHSGTEIILWPYGWTTAPPPEEALYQILGDELTALTGVPHGQTSRVLYAASGTTMDQAYGSSEGWRAISVSPETYGGSGGAFDWWHYFNPPENDAAITPVTDRWSPFLWHLATEAPAYRPATLGGPLAVEIGPDAGVVPVHVEGAARRPFIDTTLHLEPDGAPVRFDSANPVPLPGSGGPHDIGFTLLAERGGAFDARLVLDAGPAGVVERTLSLELVQVGAEMTLAREVMGTPDDNEASVTIDVGPFDVVNGTVSFHVAPSGLPLGERPFEATGSAPATVAVAFDASGLAAGDHEVVAEVSFVASDSDGARTGLAHLERPLQVLRPDIHLDKRMPEAGPALTPVPILSVFHNAGTMTADGLVVTETLPPGTIYWFREGPVPIPTDPLGAPEPDEVVLLPDGSTSLTWRLGEVPPDGLRALRYRILPLVPGEIDLPSEWTYTGDFDAEQVVYAANATARYVVH